MFEKIKAAYHGFWNKFDAQLDNIAAKDPHLVKTEPFRVAQTSDGRLQILVGSLSEKVAASVFFAIFLTMLSFGSVISMNHNAPSAFFLNWQFITAAGVYLLILIYTWTQGFVVLDRINGKLIIKLWHYKFLGAKEVEIADTQSWHLDKVKAKSEHNHKYLKYKFSVRVNSGDYISILTVNGKTRGENIKKAIEKHLGMALSPSRKNIRKW